ncbi:hypothetical protein GQ457_03G035040 [Hibiscus cannabinus]
MAWDKGFRRIIIEVDSLDVIRVLKEDRRQGHICTLILHIQMLLRRSWEVRVLHVLRCDNSVVDRLAKLANSDSTCVKYFEDPPPSIVQILQKDVASISVIYDFFSV